MAACAGASAEDAIRLLQRAVAHFYAAASDEAGQREYAEASQQLADLLKASDRLPEALQAYQEAADVFAGVPGGQERSKICARAIVEGGHRLRETPEQRLHLLVAKYERQVRQLEIEPASEAERAEIVLHLATMLHRRNRHREALSRYLLALRLFEQVPDRELRRAECCQRIGWLYHHAFEERHRAAVWYRRAIALFSSHEPEVGGVQPSRRACENMLTALGAEGDTGL